MPIIRKQSLPYNEYVLLIVTLVIIRHIVLTTKPELVFSGYVFMFVIGFSISYYVSRNVHIATVIGLLMVYGRMIYRYLTPLNVLSDYAGPRNTFIFTVGIISIIALSHFLKTVRNTTIIEYVLYFMLIYLQASMIEWVLHKYIMHCYAYWPWLHKSTSNDFITSNMRISCQFHQEHHMSVKNDMTLKHETHENSLIFTWETLLMVLVIGLVLSYVVTKILNLRIPLMTQIIALVVLTILYGIIWNNIHPRMHDTSVQLPLHKGPGDINMRYNDILYENHKLHHIIKGEEKGNFNVVFLGMDELMMTNNLGR